MILSSKHREGKFWLMLIAVLQWNAGILPLSGRASFES
jgi:hypothetical protein